MENKLLQPLLHAGLLEIGDNDERLASIEKSIADLQKTLNVDKSLLPNYTLVALDPHIPDTEPVLIAVETIVSAHWKALRIKFTDRPIPVLRAVILNALYNTGIADPTNARIIYLTAANFYPYAKLGREKQAIENMLAELGDVAEKQAGIEWSLMAEEPSLKLSSLKVNSQKIGEIKIADGDLRANLKQAAKNTPAGHGPYHHQDQWSEHFAKYAGDGIVAVLNKAFAQLTAALSNEQIETSLNKFFGEFKKTLDQTLKTSFNSIQAVERRSKLLWWKETLYSSSLKGSYRQLVNSIQPVIMAFDLYEQLPDIAPISVDYLLRDTVLMLNPAAAEHMTFDQLLEEFDSEANKALIKGYFSEIGAPPGRVTITEFFSLMVHGKLSRTAFKDHTGISGKEQIALTSLAVIILHDLMAEYLIKE